MIPIRLKIQNIGSGTGRYTTNISDTVKYTNYWFWYRQIYTTNISDTVKDTNKDSDSAREIQQMVRIQFKIQWDESNSTKNTFKGSDKTKGTVYWFWFIYNYT